MTSIWTFDPEHAAKKLRSLIKKEANSGELELDRESVQTLKEICRKFGEPIIKDAYNQCMAYLCKNHSQVRIAALNLIDFFFQRSHKFRCSLLDDFDTFLMLTIQVTQSEKEKVDLPPPKKFSQILKERTIKIINAWNADYGDGYEKLRYAHRYLREHRLVDFAQSRIIDREAQIREAEKRAKQEKLLLKMIKNRIIQLDELAPETDQLIAQIESLLEIIMPSIMNESSQSVENDSGSSNNHQDSTEIEEVDDFQNSSTSRRLHGIIHYGQQVEIEISPYVSVVRNEENDSIIDSLKDLRKELVDNKLPKLKVIMQSMTKRAELCTEQIKKCIDLKHKAMNTVIRLSELKIVENGQNTSKANLSGTTLENESNSDDQEFEEVPEKEDLELYIPKSMRSEYGIEEPQADSHQPSTSRYQSEVRPACKAQLPTGKLCPRRDKVKCPFHGKIIPRDEFGVPINEYDRCREERQAECNALPEWQDPELLRDIQAMIGIDLTMPNNKTHSQKKKSKLVNARTCDLTPQQRLQKRMKKMAS